MIQIEYIPHIGNYAGKVFKPHQFKDGSYVVSKTRFQRDYMHVDTYEEIIKHLDMGYRVRVSDSITKSSPSLVRKESLKITY